MSSNKHLDDILKIKSPYQETPAPFCYPGAILTNENLVKIASHILPLQLNNIGTHTQPDRRRNGI